jgi:hypothetical protein
VGSAVDVLVLATSDLVADRLSSGLLRVWTSAAIDHVSYLLFQIQNEEQNLRDLVTGICQTF